VIDKLFLVVSHKIPNFMVNLGSYLEVITGFCFTQTASNSAKCFDF